MLLWESNSQLVEQRKSLEEGKIMKRNLKNLLVACCSLVTLVGCGDKTSEAGKTDGGETKTGDVINIWCWNSEFQGRFNSYYPEVKSVDGTTTTLKSGKKVHFIIHANDNNGYQIPLDQALKSQDKAAADDKIDMFLLEADYALKYVDTDYTLDVKKDIGLTDDDLANMYDYTKTIATDSNGALKGVSWQATPGLYAYRTDLAEQVYGEGEATPEKMQARLSDWTKFDSAAQAAQAKGVKMVSGYDDMYRVFSNNATTSWVDGSGKVTVDKEIKNWVKKEKSYVDGGMSGKTELWSEAWAKDQGPDGNVMGFFYSTWGINFTLLGNSLADANAEKKLGNGLFGKYRVIEGPASYYWGGTWMAGCKGSDNIPEIRDIMQKLTCDKDIAKKITVDTEDYTNNKLAMNELASDPNYGSAFLGGQNHVALFAKSADKIRLAAMSGYDQGCNEQYQKAMRDYFAGTVTFEKANANFETQLKALYPEVTFNDQNKVL